MFKRILLYSLFIFIFHILWIQDIIAKTSQNAKTQVDSIVIIAFERHATAKTWKNCKVPTDSIIAAFIRNEDIVIDSCEIFGNLRLTGNTINSSIRILRSVFHDAVSFADCRFMKEIRFVEDSLIHDINSYEVIFNRHVDFSRSIFRGSVSFNYSNFKESATFTGAIFDTTVMFVRSSFDQDIWFQHTTFGGDVYFNCLDFGNKADFLGARFKRKVSMEAVDFRNMFISWEQLKDHLWSSRNFYSQLIRNFEENRQFDDADAVYLKMKRSETARMKWNEASKYIGYLMWVTCGYGVKPFYTLLWSGAIIVLFALSFRKSNAIKEIEAEFGSPRKRRRFRIEAKRSKKRFLDALYFSFQTFIVGVVSDRYPTDEFLINTKSIKRFRFRTISMIEGALGWILVILFIASLGKKFLR